jgi:hypothetical protein
MYFSGKKQEIEAAKLLCIPFYRPTSIISLIVFTLLHFITPAQQSS